nr:ribonuclease H-like domain-containing protein [Tanacetum cinerariifolium]
MTGPEELLSKLLDKLGYNNSQASANQHNVGTVATHVHGATLFANIAYHKPSLSNPGPLGPLPGFQAQQFSTTHPVIGPAYLTSPQATVLPHAFTAGTFHDPTTGAWHMDTCASSYLNNSVTSLSENFNTFTTPSPIPHAFLVSQYTWHQRLGHLEGEMLRRLVSSNFI